ncbi:hypothetical protein ACFLZ7_04490 [Nanoarchaeota archaeon]
MKSIKKITMYLVLVVLLMQTVLAIGVSPAVTKIDFEPGMNKEVTIRILNNEHKDFNALISVQGDLEDYIALDKTMVEISSDEDTKSFKYRFKLPEQLENPGKYRTDIIIAEVPKKAANNGGLISAGAAVVSQLIVNVPYPGTYAEAKLHMTEGKVNEEMQFAVAVFNLGKEDLEGVYAKLEIYDGDSKISELTTNYVDIDSKGQSRLSANWLPGKPGKYKVLVNVFYSDKTITLEQPFEVGGIDLKIESLSIHDFSLGEIVRTYVVITNTWGSKLLDVFANVIVRDEIGRVVSQIDTTPIDIEPFSSASATGFWDTEDIFPGMYELEVSVDYYGTQTSRTFSAKVTQNDIEIEGMTGQVVRESPFNKPDGMTILIIVAINLVILNVILVVYLRRRKPPTQNIISKFLLFLR